MISADVIADIKQQKIKEMKALSYNFYSTFKTQNKIQNSCIFFIKFWLLFYPAGYCRLRTGDFGFFLFDKYRV